MLRFSSIRPILRRGAAAIAVAGPVQRPAGCGPTSPLMGFARLRCERAWQAAPLIYHLTRLAARASIPAGAARRVASAAAPLTMAPVAARGPEASRP